MTCEPEESVPEFQGGLTRYRRQDLPTDFDVDDFIASWNEAT